MSVQFVIIGSYQTPAEAHIVAGRLRSAGISAEILDEHFVSANWLYSNAIGGVRVQVPEDELSAAEELLRENVEVEPTPIEATSQESTTSEVPAQEVSTSPQCPKCASADTYYFRKSFGTILSWLLLGIPLLLPRGFRRCEQCGHAWRYRGARQ